MKEKHTNPNQRYRFRFDPITLAVLIAVLALCCACFGLTTWQMIGFLKSSEDSVAAWFQYGLLYLVSVFLAVVVVAMFVCSRYLITDSALILQLGVIRLKYKLETIDSVKLLKGSNKLVVYLNDEKPRHLAIVIKDTLYDDFAKTLIGFGSAIVYDFVTAEEEKPPKDKKK